MLRIIGISGKKHSGKSTFASNLLKVLSEESDIQWKEYSFADPVKMICSMIEGVDVSFYYDDAKKKETTKFGFTRRQMMQIVGTDIAQNHIHLHYTDDLSIQNLFSLINPSFHQYLKHNTFIEQDDELSKLIWVRYFVDQIYNKHPNVGFILADIRFEHEADVVNELDGFLLRLIGDPQQLNDNVGNEHISETALDNYTKFSCIVETDAYSPDDVYFICKDLYNLAKV
jgi:uncharacterized protein YtpQ (UPF0354 family)